MSNFKLPTRCTPLVWPRDVDRNVAPVASRFKRNGKSLRDFFFDAEDELRRLGNESILTIALRGRQDGRPNFGSTPTDDAVCGYAKCDGQVFQFAVDEYLDAWENLRAMTKIVEGLRTIRRHGGAQGFTRAALGFVRALPAAEPRLPWREVLGDLHDFSLAKVVGRELLRRTHPDRKRRPGEEDCPYSFQQVQDALTDLNEEMRRG